MTDAFRKRMIQLRSVHARLSRISVARDAKIEAVKVKWAKCLVALQRKTSRARNVKEAHEFVTRLQKIQPEVRDYLIKAWVQRCILKHSIAYFQWR